MKQHLVASVAGLGLLAFGALAAAKSEHADRSAKNAAAAPSGSAHLRSAQDDMAEQFRKHRPNGPELQAKLAELRATGGARRAAHVAELRVRFGAAALHDKALVGELRAHARRVAFLNRAKLVATTELDEPKRTAALARIDKLMAREQQRHERRVEKLKAMPPQPGPSGAPAAPSAAAPAGSAQ